MYELVFFFFFYLKIVIQFKYFIYINFVVFV